MPTYAIDIVISADELARFYRGSARMVHARSRCGVTLQFPAQWLRPYVSHQGLRGSFELATDHEHRLRHLRPL
ncbi:MAG: DUF2835 family protein [Pseudomonadales bacterium]